MDHTIIDKENPCPECGNIEWLSIPDSLGQACINCTYVRVGTKGNWKKGTSLVDWAKDIYESSKETK